MVGVVNGSEPGSTLSCHLGRDALGGNLSLHPAIRVGLKPEIPMRFLPTRLHGLIDYLWGLALLSTPWLLGYADVPAAKSVAIVFGVGAILYSLVTDYERGLIRILPIPAHLLLDGIAGLLLAASPFLLGFADRVYLPHLCFGLFSVTASLLTRMDPMQPSGRRTSFDA
jgi:hypothetical protein